MFAALPSHTNRNHTMLNSLSKNLKISENSSEDKGAARRPCHPGTDAAQVTVFDVVGLENPVR